MYVTRLLSSYRNSPETLSLPPPEGPNSGYLVILDPEAERRIFFGLFKSGEIKDLPFPQNKNLTICYSSGSGENQHTSHDDVILIPVINQPLSSNCYYAIKPKRSHRGEAYVSSTDADMGTCFCCSYVRDIKPRQFDPQDLYQQFEIIHKKGGFTTWRGFTAKSVASDGYPPDFMRRKGWTLSTKTPKHYKLMEEALGLDDALRKRLPDFNFPLSCRTSERVVVGKWYCPFIFIRDGALQDQVKKSVYYEMTLEQYWEQIFTSENSKGDENAVFVDVGIPREVVLVDGEPEFDTRNVADGVLWFNNGKTNVGLSLLIVERMKWEQNRAGWADGNEMLVNVKRVEEFGGADGWKEFACYVLVERFVLKRMDGSLVLTYDFKHVHQIKSIWE